MKERIVSVDIFRGLTIALMILVNTPGTWEFVYPPLRHADWHGYTPTDLVFPFFLFIVGTSIVFAYRNKVANAATYKKISIRTLKLIGLGLFLGAFTISFPFINEFDQIRFPGVLQRIGVVFFFAAVLFLNFNWKALIGICLAILVGYWVWLGFIPLLGEVPTFDRAPNNWANYLDVQVFGSHNYKEDYDPEGLLSTLPSIASSLLGIFTGLILVSKRAKKEMVLVGLGVIMLVIGYLWDMAFPINKAIWSSSFVLVTAGWANIFLALIYFLTDVKGIQFGSIFRYMGSNAITLYFLSSFVSKLFNSIKVNNDSSVHQWLFENIYRHDFLSGEFSSLLYGLTVVGFYLLMALVMYRKKIFIKV
ncbi:heparan-alpha-glucosaminide N-acetyltransferase domain-containing protein [uncultured Muriicola sp.]|uniref:acyltransferase family protein n=1 Tax=uncultured Muriicola sp. TaxID=1583102 RepID=UPI002613D28D|nr:heparan-alpha-glucosaminide N-acetyltransferase domain-containing protein [uncultured Muriicola sp.]